MDITTTPEDRIIELPGDTFDPWDPPTAGQLEDVLSDEGFEIDGQPPAIVAVSHCGGRWVAEYADSEPDFEAIWEARRQDPDPDFHDSNFYDITSRR